MRVLTKNKLITDFFGHWYQVYQGLGRGNFIDLIRKPLPKAVDKAKKDLFLSTRVSVEVDLKRNRGVSLPPAYVPPKVKRKKPAEHVLTVKFTIDVGEAMYLFGKYGIDGSPSDPSKAVEQNLLEAIRDDVLDRAKKWRAGVTGRSRHRGAPCLSWDYNEANSATSTTGTGTIKRDTTFGLIVETVDRSEFSR